MDPWRPWGALGQKNFFQLFLQLLSFINGTLTSFNFTRAIFVIFTSQTQASINFMSAARSSLNFTRQPRRAQGRDERIHSTNVQTVHVAWFNFRLSLGTSALS